MAFINRILPAPTHGGFSLDDHWVWCGSVIRGEDGRWHMFASRWPAEYPFFEGYQVRSEVVRASAPAPEGPYTFEEVVLPPRGEDAWDGRMTHNPAICRTRDGFALFYIGATFRGPVPEPDSLRAGATPVTREAYASIRIGCALAPSVRGPWRRPDAPVLDVRPGRWDAAIVTNPAPCILKDGGVLLYYRSNTPDGLRIGCAAAEAPAGPFRRLADDPILRFPGDDFVEDPFVWQSGDGFEMIAKDMKGGITGEVHAGMHARSADGLSWSVSRPPKAYSRRLTWDDGRVTVQGCLERPSLVLDGDIPTHLVAATADGPGGFRNCTRSRTLVIPLAPPEPGAAR